CAAGSTAARRFATANDRDRRNGHDRAGKSDERIFHVRFRGVGSSCLPTESLREEEKQLPPALEFFGSGRRSRTSFFCDDPPRLGGALDDAEEPCHERRDEAELDAAGGCDVGLSLGVQLENDVLAAWLYSRGAVP